MASEKQSAMVLEIQPKSLLITGMCPQKHGVLYTDPRNLGSWDRDSVIDLPYED